MPSWCMYVHQLHTRVLHLGRPSARQCDNRTHQRSRYYIASLHPDLIVVAARECIRSHGRIGVHPRNCSNTTRNAMITSKTQANKGCPESNCWNKRVTWQARSLLHSCWHHSDAAARSSCPETMHCCRLIPAGSLKAKAR